MANTDTKTQEKVSFIQGVKTYFKGVKSEWGKVTWPEKNQIIAETAIVAIVVFAFTSAVFLMDLAFKWILGKIN